MLYPGTCIILVVIANFHLAIGSSLPKDDSAKGFERDFQMCMDNFYVNTDIIIRTQDSRKLGAKYLNDMDVDSRYDCKRFCCETELCDVFVYEEKKPGSCYLFHCGPPQDFKCKFTNHTSYSSAILTIAAPQQNLQIEEQIRRIKQEHELKSLRKMSETGSLEYPIAELTVPPPVVTQKPTLINKTICSRNQYECKSTRECIAIYNVCDGIPQCADGSDESSDLGCPTEKPTMPPQTLLPKPLLPVIADMPNYQMLPHHKSYASSYEHNLEQENGKSWPGQNQMVPGQMNVQYPVDRMMPQVNVGYPRYQWNYPPYYDPNKDPYNMNPPHGQKMIPYEQEQPRIFHHKKPGITNENMERPAYETKPFVPYYIPSNREAWSDDQQVRIDAQVEPQPEPKLEPQIEQGEIIQVESNSQAVPQPPSIPEKQPEYKELEKPQVEPRPHTFPAQQQKIEVRPTVAPQVVQTQVTKLEKVMKSMPNPSECNPVVQQDVKITEAEPEKKVVQVETSKPKVIMTEEVKSPEVKQESSKPAKKEEKMHHIPSHRKMEENPSSVAEHFRLENHEEEHMKPKGAVISLALGLTVTAIMAVLIVCRLRVVRRRGRRRHEPYAHDADYLVNGMYL